MNRIIIMPNPQKDVGFSVARMVADRLKSIGMQVFIDEKLGVDVGGVQRYSNIPCADLIIVIGGDGSVIDASRYAIEQDIPLLGVNLGRVGYLSEVDPADLEILERLSTGEYSVKEKMLLTVESKPNGVSEVYAVNDVIVSHGEYLGISEFRLEDSCGNSLEYRADGVIIATPQGSTAYSFSSGGPVLAHDVEGILVTPVCPHSFFNRSVLFNSSEMLSVQNIGAYPMNIAVDGRKYAPLMPRETCYIRCASQRIKMLTFSENKMFTELFKKMNITEGLK